jgi:hypothetical protein
MTRQEDLAVMVRTLSPLALLAGCLAASPLAAQGPSRRPLDASPAAAPSNQALASAVADALGRSGQLHGRKIDVSAQNGCVDLAGTVADRAQHDALIQVALTVPGVATVRDSMTMAGGRPPASGVMQAQAVLPPGTTAPPPPGMISPVPNGVMPAPMAGPMPGMPGMPTSDPLPMPHPNGPSPYDMNPPRMPPYAWPTYAPYNNFSRVGYPEAYPYNAWPFIGPFYPFPKVPLGWRSVTLQWEDGHWYYGRFGTGYDHWRVRFW